MWDVRRTANITPSSARDISGIGLRRPNDGGGTAVGIRDSPPGTCLHRVAAGKFREPSSNRLINTRGDEAISDGAGGEELEGLAFLNDTRVIVAGVDSLLECRDIPSVNEITVVS